ncbi:Adenosine deaminase/editase [Rhypophila sp. PSN 637]
MSTEFDEIASIVLDEFGKLPAKRKPCVRDNGLHEWVPLSGIVAKGPGWIRCVALATGMKCLPASKLPQASGTAIHDWHAEVLAIRAFNYFILEECRRLALGNEADKKSDFIRRRTDVELEGHAHEDPWHGQPFAWREDVSLHMYCSEAPCGDASMELIMAAQDDASPWDLPPPEPLPDNDVQDTGQSNPTGAKKPESLLGRGYFSQLGIVRRKPSRGDAPPSLSKSCSDKLALKQCTSLLSSLSSLFVFPNSAYLTSIILPESQYSSTGCQRCFFQDGRMKPLLPYLHKSKTTEFADNHSAAMSETWKNSGYTFSPFAIETTKLEFDFSKRTATAKAAAEEAQQGVITSGPKIVASNLAVAWTANGLNEGIIGGVLQGRKKLDLKGASAVSRRKTWRLAAQVAEGLAALSGARSDGGEEADLLVKSLLSNQDATYDEIKEYPLLKGRKAVKEEARREALKGWVKNIGDGGFRLSDQ